MAKWAVDLTRVGFGHTTIELEFDTEEEAVEYAEKHAGDYDYREHDCDHEVSGVRRITPGQTG